MCSHILVSGISGRFQIDLYIVINSVACHGGRDRLLTVSVPAWECGCQGRERRYIGGEGNKAEWQKGQGTFESLKSHRAVAKGQKEEAKL